MTLQSEVIKRLGGFGAYQKRLCFILCLIAMTLATFTLVTLFVMYVPPHRCHIDELEERNYLFEVPSQANNSQSNSNLSLISAYIPLEVSLDGEYRWDQCNQYLAPQHNGTLNDTGPCQDGWTYLVEPGVMTAVMEFNLVCDKSWAVPLAPSLLLAGFMLGALFGGYLSDRYGRKKSLVVSFALLLVGAVVMAWTPVAAGVYVGMTMIGMSAIMRTTSTVVFISESTSRNVAKKLNLFAMLAACVGTVILPVVAYLIPHWRWMITAMSIAALLLLPAVIFFVEESVIWILQTKRAGRSREVMKRIAKINNVPLESSEALTERLAAKEGAEAAAVDNGQGDAAESSTKLTYIHLLRVSFLRKRLLILSLALFTISMVYYGLALNANRLAGNRYVNCFLVALVDVPGYAVWFFLVSRLGCRQIYVLCSFSAGIMLLAVPLFRSANEMVETIFAMIAKFFIGGSFLVMYLFTGDFFPTLLRNQAYGASSFFARMGGILVPYLLYLGDVVHFSVPYLVMGFFCLAASVAVYFLPETKDLELPVTLDDARELESHRPKLGCAEKKKQGDENRNTSTAPTIVYE